jgi:hypothetical protein
MGIAHSVQPDTTVHVVGTNHDAIAIR